MANKIITVENNLKVIELRGYDILNKTDVFKQAQSLIKQHQDKYPNIAEWFKEKALPEIRYNRRKFYMGLNNDIPIASAIVKNGSDAKFCHLHIDEKYRQDNLGDLLFILMGVYVKNYARNIHFSLPEGLWHEKGGFFKSFGVDAVTKYKTQYRKGEEELYASVDFRTFWYNAINKIPDLYEKFKSDKENPINGILLSVHPKYANKISEGEKVIELRRKFNKNFINHLATIYSTSPEKTVLGNALIENVVEDKPENIWLLYNHMLGCSRSEFDDYTNGYEKISAVFLGNFKKYKNLIPLNELSHIFNSQLLPPQSYSIVNNNKEWTNAISLLEILQGELSAVSRSY